MWPLVFHLPTAAWFGDAFVAAELPDPNDVKTVLQVSAWTWNWMAPPLETLSFMMLCFLVARHVRGTPASTTHWREEKVIAQYPQYAPMLLRHFVRACYTHGR